MYCEWSTVWQGHPIVVKICYRSDLFFRLTEELWIGDLIVDRNKIISWLPSSLIYKRLGASISIVDDVHQLETLIYYADKPYCNISIDAEIIGGDVDAKIPQTDLLIEWPEIRRRGFCRFLVDNRYFNMLRLTFAFLYFPIVFVLLHFMGRVSFSWEFILPFTFQCAGIVMPGILFGILAIGFSYWRTGEKLYAQALAHQQKLNAPAIRLESRGVLKDVL